MRPPSEISRAIKAKFEINQYPETAVYEAQALYMRYAPIAKISLITGIDINTLQSFVYGEANWKGQREALHKEINEELKHNALKQLKRIGASTLDLVEDSVSSFRSVCKESGLVPTLEQAFMLTQMYGLIHKAKMSEEGTDDGKASLALAPDEVIKALAADPYLSAVFDGQKQLTASEKIEDKDAE
jgi:ribosomal protein S19E (S16A)